MSKGRGSTPCPGSRSQRERRPAPITYQVQVTNFQGSTLSGSITLSAMGILIGFSSKCPDSECEQGCYSVKCLGGTSKQLFSHHSDWSHEATDGEREGKNDLGLSDLVAFSDCSTDVGIEEEKSCLCALLQRKAGLFDIKRKLSIGTFIFQL